MKKVMPLFFGCRASPFPGVKGGVHCDGICPCTARLLVCAGGAGPLSLLDLSQIKRLSQRTKKWSGWQELNLRGHVPKTCGCPLAYTRMLERVFSLTLGVRSCRPVPF